MAELQLTRASGDRRLFALEGVGTLRMAGAISRSTATAEAGTRRWQITYRGMLQPVVRATDAAGAVVGEYKVGQLRRGGALRWSDRDLALRSDSLWRGRYVLVEGDRRLATIEGKAWGKSPAHVTADESALTGPGLLLFAVFVVRALAQNTAASAATG